MKRTIDEVIMWLRDYPYPYINISTVLNVLEHELDVSKERSVSKVFKSKDDYVTTAPKQTGRPANILKKGSVGRDLLEAYGRDDRPRSDAEVAYAANVKSNYSPRCAELRKLGLIDVLGVYKKGNATIKLCSITDKGLEWLKT